MLIFLQGEGVKRVEQPSQCCPQCLFALQYWILMKLLTTEKMENMLAGMKHSVLHT